MNTIYKAVYLAKDYECLSPDVSIDTDQGILSGVLISDNGKILFLQKDKLDSLSQFTGLKQVDKNTVEEVYEEI